MSWWRFQAWEKPNCSSSCTAAHCRCATPCGGYSFSARVVTVARTACRLRDDFELDTRGVGVALKLLERVRDLEQEIARLRAQTPGI